LNIGSILYQYGCATREVSRTLTFTERCITQCP